MSLWTLRCVIRMGNKCQGGLAVHPELPSGASQTPELEPSACPGLGSLAGAGEGFQAGSWMPPLELVLLIIWLGHSVAVAVPWGCALPPAPSGAVLGLRADPKPSTYSLIWGRGAWGSSDAVLIHSPSNSLCHGSYDGPVLTVMGAGSRGMGGHGPASPQPAAPHCPRDPRVPAAPPILEATLGVPVGQRGGPRRWREDTLGELSWPAPLQLGALGNKSPRSDSPKQL